MKIGILTFHRSRNYGAFLQSYALCNKLNSEDFISAEIIDFQTKKEVDFYNRLSKGKLRHPVRMVHDIKSAHVQQVLFDKDMSNQILSDDSLISDSIEEFKKTFYGKYDAIVVGSDEVWKTNGFRGFPTPYWLIGDLGCRKVSYAASARNSFIHLSTNNIKMLEQAIDDFSFIGVQDSSTFNEIIRHCPNNKKIYR